MAKVSVIIPTHNRALLLCRAVDSVLKQTFQDFEIIIIDDGSTDRTVEFARGSGDARIRYHRNEKNCGEGESRNAGLRLARGEYIAFIDDDDQWLPEKLAKQVALLDAARPEVGLVYTGYRRIDLDSGRVIATILPEARGPVLRALASSNCIGAPSTVLARRSCFVQAGGFDASVIFGIDYDMWIRIARDYEFEYIREPLVLYTVHGDRLSTNTVTVWRGKEAQLERYEQFFAGDRKAFARYLLALGVLRCYNRELRRGRAAFWRAIKTNPFETRAYFNGLLSLLGGPAFIHIKELKERIGGALRAPASLFAEYLPQRR